MKSATFAAVSLMASVAIAQPHGHQHMDKHHKRADTVVWVTDWVSTTTTIDITTTIWVSEGFVPPTSAASPSAQPDTSSSADQQPAQFFEPASSAAPVSSTSVSVAPTPSTTATLASVPVSTAAPVAPTVAVVNTPSPSPSPVQSSSTSSPPPVFVPQTTLSSQIVAPTTTSAAPVVATTSQASSGGSSSGGSGLPCTSGSPCTGDMTFYDITADEYGSCGVGADGLTENIVALSAGILGTVSNGNPLCGSTITIVNPANGQTTTAKVIDKCPTCSTDSIDLSRAAFGQLADFGIGRTTCKWWFN
ncbi:hypothetical protein G7Y89_g1847 [Cudoniella acicularis]|uniref:RlpA-like protein double-psi beta-barrel domain-containing protein n=1 Tax=Cudoniella acicularis TaxID=354080 RepID=A0A8H4RVK1_9HELO|nr:hypothetical protein G7Y89_g1847 [Cudoniella acicularis]